jgi:predicted ATPase with chaperone activity
MNLLKLSDKQLAELRQSIDNEAQRRTKAAVNGHDAGNIIYGNELAKRAAMIAAAGNHSILFVGPPNCGKTMLRALCLALGLTETYEARRCPCGHFEDPYAECKCTTRQVERTIAKWPVVDIAVEVVRPRERDRSYRGTSMADMRQCISTMTRFTEETLDENATCLLRAASKELGLDLVGVARVIGVARTIANLDQREMIVASHISEAINYRMLR